MDWKRIKVGIVAFGEEAMKHAVNAALVCHFPGYELDSGRRTRISVVVPDREAVDDAFFEYQELFDNSFRRIVDLTGRKPVVETYRPQYEGSRKDFVDIEWEFIIGRISNPMLQEKLRRRAADENLQLVILLCFADPELNAKYAATLGRRLPQDVVIKTFSPDPEGDAKREEELLEMAKYVNYFYQASYDLKHVPTELPEDEVEKAWATLDDLQRRSNIYNVMAIPVKMAILGHDRADWNTFYALTADEIEQLTAVEHNRWTVERLIQGTRPCTDAERREIQEDMERRLSDPEYAAAHPVSLKKKYKTELNAHFDLCAYSELGVDETRLPVTRYDRDLTAAIPLIVKTFNDRRKNG